MQNNVQSFNIIGRGRYVQLKWKGQLDDFKIFLKTINHDFFENGWGYDNVWATLITPTKEYVSTGRFLVLDGDGKFNVSSMDLSEIVQPI